MHTGTIGIYSVINTATVHDVIYSHVCRYKFVIPGLLSYVCIVVKIEQVFPTKFNDLTAQHVTTQTVSNRTENTTYLDGLLQFKLWHDHLRH